MRQRIDVCISHTRSISGTVLLLQPAPLPEAQRWVIAQTGAGQVTGHVEIGDRCVISVTQLFCDHFADCYRGTPACLREEMVVPDLCRVSVKAQTEQRNNRSQLYLPGIKLVLLRNGEYS